MKELKKTPGYRVIFKWLKSKGYKAFAFQEETWQHIINNKSGLVNAPTGTGKTFSVFLGALIQFINQHPSKRITINLGPSPGKRRL
jgi:ATP-dependent Lhr-like helicase